MNLLTSGKLHSYLAEVDKQAEDMFLRLVKEYADRQDVTEQLKKDNPYEWIGRMNCFEFTDDGIVYEGDIFPSKTFSGIGKVGDITVSCIEPLSQVMLHLGYEHDKNDVHDVMLLCETFQIAIPDEYKEK